MSENIDHPSGFSKHSSVYNYGRQKLMDLWAIDDPRATLDKSAKEPLSDLWKIVALNDITKLPDGRVLMPYKQWNDLYVFIFSVKPHGTKNRPTYDPWPDTFRVDTFKNGKHIWNYDIVENSTFETQMTPIFDKVIWPSWPSVWEGVSPDKRTPRRNLLNESRRVYELLYWDPHKDPLSASRYRNGPWETKHTTEDTITTLKWNFKNWFLDGKWSEIIEWTNMFWFNPRSKIRIVKEWYFENWQLLDGSTKYYVNWKPHQTYIFKAGNKVSQ